MNIGEFYQSLQGKTVAVCGIGRNNTPVILQLLSHGISVIACDKHTREELGETAEKLASAGATLQLGEQYLDTLDAQLILRTPGMKPYLPPFQKAREEGKTVTSEMELFFDLCPAPIYAVTGSDGKTTTTTVIAGLLEAAKKTVHLGGNIGRALLPIIENVESHHAAVVELSSFQLTMMEQSPHVAVVTNVAPNHLDWHTDMQEYIDAKKNLVAHQRPQDRAVLNADNEITASFADSCVGEVWYFSRKHPVKRGTYLGEDGILYGTDGVTTVPILPACEIRIPGVHNIENFLAAFAAVWGEVPVEIMADYARTFSGVPHRSELVRERDGVRWYNDSIGSSPSRTIAGLRSFDRKVILIAGGYDKHIPYDPLGPVAKDTVKTAILLGATANAIETAIRAVSDLPIIRVADMAEAVKTAEKEAKSGDIVFMSPASASFDMYTNFEERGDHFKRLVLEL
ncbi:MAG: UDP-N-acetylmuramoyl-L-alanine--D-glutamate ligase [Clostridia bacterium]|nr:UDP-N-acetylmuramoyl-L-alanine--D-glutamate ligase [Clostridia bacterium]